MSSPEQVPKINFPTEEELRASAQKRFQDIRAQQELDRQAAQGQAQQVFGEGSLGRVEEGRAGEIATALGQSGQLATSGTQELQALAAQRAQTVATGGQDPAFRQIAEAARRGQDVQTQTSLRQLRGELGAQGVRGGINLQNQIATLGQGNLAEAQLQGQLAQARLSRVSEAQAAQEGLQQNILSQQGQLQQQAANQLFAARAEEQGRADTNVQRALQERLGRLQLTEARAQQGTLERAAASQEVTAAAQLQAQLEQQNIANRIALAEANKEPAKTEVHQSGGKVLCTELCRQGLISEEILEGDLIYAKSVAIETKVGYWVWAKPLAEKCKTSKVLTYMALPFVKAWATEMAYQVGRSEKGSILGKIMTKTFEPACNLLGRALIKFNLVNLERLASHTTYNK
jgi:hypothetical protein